MHHLRTPPFELRTTLIPTPWPSSAIVWQMSIFSPTIRCISFQLCRCHPNRPLCGTIPMHPGNYLRSSSRQLPYCYVLIQTEKKQSHQFVNSIRWIRWTAGTYSSSRWRCDNTIFMFFFSDRLQVKLCILMSITCAPYRLVDCSLIAPSFSASFAALNNCQSGVWIIREKMPIRQRRRQWSSVSKQIQFYFEVNHDRTRDETQI